MPPTLLISCVAAKQATSYFGPSTASTPVNGATTEIVNFEPAARAGDPGSPTAIAAKATAANSRVSFFRNRTVGGCPDIVYDISLICPPSLSYMRSEEHTSELQSL